MDGTKGHQLAYALLVAMIVAGASGVAGAVAVVDTAASGNGHGLTDRQRAATTGNATAAATGSGVTVSVEPNATAVGVGNRTTFDIVVRGADRGVGSVQATLNTTNRSAASVRNATVTIDGTIAEASSSPGGARIEVAGADAVGPTVTVATVTVRGEAAGNASLVLSNVDVGDRNQTGYDPVATDPAAVDVTGTGVALSLSANRTTLTAGGTVAFTVTREDTGADVNATVTVDGTDYRTGSDGTVAVDFPTAGQFEARATKTGDVNFLSDSVTVTVQPVGDRGVTVSLEPTTATIGPGQNDTFDVVVAGLTEGIGAYRVVINTTDVGVIAVADGTNLVGGAVERIDGRDDPATIDIGVVDPDTPRTGSVTVARVTAAAVGNGTAALRLVDVNVANESNEPYPVVRGNATVEVARQTAPLAVDVVAPAEPVADRPLLVQVTRTDTGATVNATVTVNATSYRTGADGNVSLTLAAGNYTLRATKANTSAVAYVPARRALSVPTVPPSLSVTDPDEDGLYEDFDGDGSFGIVDVAIFLDTFDDPVIADNPQLFDFTGDGTVSIADVARLLFDL